MLATGERPIAAACRAVRAQGAVADGRAITIEFSSALAGSMQPYELFRKIWENT
jgi:hypothetical protein